MSTFRLLNRRRSQRLPLTVPLFVSSLDSKIEFVEQCETTSVSRHGFSLKSPRPLEAGTKVRVDISHSDRTAVARVVYCKEIGMLPKFWQIPLEFEEAHNFWGIQAPPDDWAPEPTIPVEQGPDLKTVAPPPTTAAPVQSESDRAEPATMPVPEETPSPVRPLPQPTIEQAREQLEAQLREKAGEVLTEIEKDHRESFEAVLDRLHTDFQERAQNESNRLRQEAEESLQEIARKTRQQVDEEVERQRQAVAETEVKLQAADSLRNDVVARLQTAGEIFQQKVDEKRDAVLAQNHQQMQTLVEEFRQQINAELERSLQAGTDLQAKLEEVRQGRDSIKSLLRRLPEFVDERIREGVAAAREPLQELPEDEAPAPQEAQREELKEQFLTLAEQAGTELRQRFQEDLEAREGEAVARIRALLEEAHTAEGHLRECGSRMAAELTRQSEEIQAGFESRLDEQLARSMKEAAVTLKEPHDQPNDKRALIHRLYWRRKNL
jgi:hypothetical protein